MPYSQREVALQLFETDLEMKLEERDALRAQSDETTAQKLAQLERDITELRAEITEMRSAIEKRR
jgi:peptidoglycan hydrolase CwlO-like protein